MRFHRIKTCKMILSFCANNRIRRTLSISFIIVISWFFITAWIAPLSMLHPYGYRSLSAPPTSSSNQSDIYELMGHQVIESWVHRRGNRPTRTDPDGNPRTQKRKSKFLQECSRESEQILLRDRSLQTNLYVPSPNINYTFLRYNFWNNLVSTQHSQMHHANTLQTVQYD